MDSDLTVLAAIRALTGVIRAFELHADANPDDAVLLHSDANSLRTIRDDLLQDSPYSLDYAREDHGASREWCRAVGRLTEGSDAWGFEPSRDPWGSRD
ncbi:hypothetical protein [Nonomuraea sp. NPDC049028]|uniref:hypothetical protein n=1 Tax=Nonomuraea sp. NPDC049028 TaxID=3364348 RepID=UPI00370FB03C